MPRMDAAVPADAQHAPTGTWKTAHTAVSHSAHTHQRFDGEKKTKGRTYDVNHTSHTKFLTLPAEPPNGELGTPNPEP